MKDMYMLVEVCCSSKVWRFWQSFLTGMEILVFLVVLNFRKVIQVNPFMHNVEKWIRIH